MSPIDLQGAQPRHASGNEPDAGLHPPRPRFDPYTGEPLTPDPPIDPVVENIEKAFVQAEPVGISKPPVNPYAPTGWKRKERIEFDIHLPSGQLCRILRLERDDLFRLNLMQYLDTFTPMLLDGVTMSEDEQKRRLEQTMKEKPNAMADMFMAIDEVIQAACIKPRITTDEKLVDYGKPTDWNNPNFVPTAYLRDIEMEDRMAIFAAAFGKSMDDLKSLWRETPSMGSVADEPGVLQAAE